MAAKKQTEAKRGNRASKKLKDLHGKVETHGADSVRGGKAGKLQHEYMIVKMNDVIITSVNPSGGK